MNNDQPMQNLQLMKSFLPRRNPIRRRGSPAIPPALVSPRSPMNRLPKEKEVPSMSPDIGVFNPALAVLGNITARRSRKSSRTEKLKRSRFQKMNSGSSIGNSTKKFYPLNSRSIDEHPRIFADHSLLSEYDKEKISSSQKEKSRVPGYHKNQKRGAESLSENVKLLAKIINSSTRKNITNLKSNNYQNQDFVRKRQRTMFGNKLKKRFQSEEFRLSYRVVNRKKLRQGVENDY